MGGACGMYGGGRGDERSLQLVWWVKLEDVEHLEDLYADVMAVQRRIFKKLDKRAWTSLVGLPLG